MDNQRNLQFRSSLEKSDSDECEFDPENTNRDPESDCSNINSSHETGTEQTDVNCGYKQ